MVRNVPPKSEKCVASVFKTVFWISLSIALGMPGFSYAIADKHIGHCGDRVDGSVTDDPIQYPREREEFVHSGVRAVLQEYFGGTNFLLQLTFTDRIRHRNARNLIRSLGIKILSDSAPKSMIGSLFRRSSSESSLVIRESDPRKIEAVLSMPEYEYIRLADCIYSDLRVTDLHRPVERKVLDAELEHFRRDANVAANNRDEEGKPILDLGVTMEVLWDRGTFNQVVEKVIKSEGVKLIYSFYNPQSFLGTIQISGFWKAISELAALEEVDVIKDPFLVFNRPKTSYRAPHIQVIR